MELLDRYNYGGVQVSVETTDADGGKLVIRKRQDDTLNREFARAMGNDEDAWRQGVKKGFVMAGHIPDIVIVELRQIGVDIFKAPLKEIRAGLKKLGKEHFLWKT